MLCRTVKQRWKMVWLFVMMLICTYLHSTFTPSPPSDQELSSDEEAVPRAARVEAQGSDHDGINNTVNIQTGHNSASKKWPFPTECPPRMHYLENSSELVALASFPGSGNTWLRQILQTATGVYTGSVYHSKKMLSSGLFPAEGVQNSSVIAVKTHFAFGTDRDLNYTRAILLTRHPHDAILAEVNRELAGHIGQAPISDLKVPRVQEQMKWMSAIWQNFHVSWLKFFDAPVLVVNYEDLKLNLTKQIKRILKFLDWELSDSQIQCVLSIPADSFLREHTQSEEFIYPADIDQTIKEQIKKARQRLRRIPKARLMWVMKGRERLKNYL